MGLVRGQSYRMVKALPTQCCQFVVPVGALVTVRNFWSDTIEICVPFPNPASTVGLQHGFVAHRVGAQGLHQAVASSS
jgi:hypothetical protein